MNGIAKYILDNDRAVFFLFIIILIFGTYCYLAIPREKTPDIKVPILNLSTTLRGVSVSDSERLLIMPIEEELKSIEGIDEMTSYAFEGMARVVLKFFPGLDIKKALEDVRAKVDIIRSNLPIDATVPVVTELDLSVFPILNIALIGDLPQRTLFDIAQDLKDDIQGLTNVLKAEIAGLRKHVLEITLSPETMNGYNLQLNEIVNAVSKNNNLLGAGTLSTDKERYVLKIPSMSQGVQDIASIPIRSHGSTTITIADIATVRSTFEDVVGITRINGRPSLVLEISRRTGKNVIETINQVKELIENKKPFLPDNLDIEYAQDQSEEITENLEELQNTVIFATLLVVIIMFIFMGIGNAFLISIAIPGSFLIGIVVFYILGYTLNMVVLFSLIMAVGMLVDDSIVVSEYAHRKFLSGLSRRESFREAIIAMFWPVTSSTLTKIAVFFPLLFWPGTSGQFMRYIPVSLMTTLSASWIMSLIFIPVLGSVFSGKVLNKKKKDSRNFLIGIYENLLVKVLRYPLTFTLITVIILLSSSILYFKIGPGFEFFPNMESNNALINIRSKGNISFKERDNITRDIEKYILGTKGVKVFYSNVGIFSDEDDLIAKIQIEFDDWRSRGKVDDILKEINNKLLNVKGIKFEIEKEKTGPGSSQPIQIDLSSRNVDSITLYAKKLVDFMTQSPGFTNIKNNIISPEIEWDIKINRDKVKLLNIDINNIVSAIQLLTNGMLIAKYNPQGVDYQVDILARFPEKDRNMTSLDNLFITTDKGPISISNFITRIPVQKTSKITRVDSMNTITISSDVDDGYLANERVQFIEEYLNKNKNQDVTVIFKGDLKDSKESQLFLTKAFITALILMILVLIISFNNIYYTFVVLSAIFLSTTGVFLGLLIIDHSLSIIMGGMAIIALAGIVVNNNILLIDAFQHNIKEFDNLKDAIVNSAISRLKPILLTAGTAILGFLPMIFKISIDFFNFEIWYNSPSSQLWVELSSTISMGLLFSTLLTSFFTPALLMMSSKDRKFKRGISK